MARENESQWQELPKSRLQASGRSAFALLIAGALCFAIVMTAVSCSSGTTSGGTGASPAPATQEPAEEPEPEVTDETTAATEDEKPAEPEPDPKQAAEEKAREELEKRLEADIASVASSAGMPVGVCAIDLESGATAGYRGDEKTVSASMIKLIIAAAFLDGVESGAYSLDDYCTLQPADIVGGTGVLAGRGAGAQVTYRELLEKMISVSDNTGTNALIRTMGMDAVNAEAKKLGLAQTQLNRMMMDEASIAAGIENYLSADDAAKLLKMTYEGSLVSREASKVLLGALEQQEDWGGIRNGLPEGVPFAHKTGTLGNARHDGGIVEGDHPFVLVVLCGGEGFYEQGALNTMARVAEVVYADLVHENS